MPIKVMKKKLEQSRFTTKVIKIHGPRVENKRLIQASHKLFLAF